MSDSYTKLFSSITASTIVSEPLATRWLWVTMLAMADGNGDVHGSVPGLARIANITLADCEIALACFLGPDAYSRTRDNEGRRIEEIDGGWRLLNHAKYRHIRSAEERREYMREYMRKRRAGEGEEGDSSKPERKHKLAVSTEVTPPAPTPTPEKKDQKRQARASRLPDGWQPSEAVREWARSEFPAVSLATVLPEFVDYWQSIPGQRGCKLSWDATFRNRVREVAARQRSSHGTHRESSSERVARINAEAEQREAAERAGNVIEGIFRVG